MKHVRKPILALVVIALTWTLLPAVSAQAYPGTTAGCYGIKKKGNYNRLHIEVSGVRSGNRIAARAEEGVTARCQRVNSMPLVRLVIDHTWLVVNGRTRAGAGIHQTTSHASVSSRTGFVSVSCTATLQAIAKVHYVYYDHATVRAFRVFGPKFSRPC